MLRREESVSNHRWATSQIVRGSQTYVSLHFLASDSTFKGQQKRTQPHLTSAPSVQRLKAKNVYSFSLLEFSRLLQAVVTVCYCYCHTSGEPTQSLKIGKMMLELSPLVSLLLLIPSCRCCCFYKYGVCNVTPRVAQLTGVTVTRRESVV